MSPKNREALFQALSNSIPNPRSELDYRNPFELLVAVILSAQATDVSVNKVTPALFSQAATPQAMLKLGIEGIAEKIKTIGLYHSKAKYIFHCCKILHEKYNDQIPENRKLLEKLPGVGPKTAGVILNVAFHHPTIPVDTHVFRVANRTGLVKAKDPVSTERSLMKVVPKWALPKAHHLLILHGRYICKASKPACSKCPIAEYCQYPDKQYQ